MAWKDLLLHLWVGSELNPLWHSCVGHAIVRRDDLKNMSKFDNKWGDVSTFFFKDIDIYSYIGQKKLNTTIIKCDDVIFKNVALCSKPMQIISNQLDLYLKPM